MTTKVSRKPFDIFLAASPADEAIANVVCDGLQEHGMLVFLTTSLELNTESEDRVRKALVESSVFVLLATGISIRAANNLLFFGAAQGLEKPIFVVMDGLAVSDIPDFMQRASVAVASVSDFSALWPKIKKAAAGLPEQQRHALGEIYRQAGVTTDQLTSRPDDLKRLTRKFNSDWSSAHTEYRILQELLRMRKQGQLPTASRGRRQPKPRKQKVDDQK